MYLMVPIFRCLQRKLFLWGILIFATLLYTINIIVIITEDEDITSNKANKLSDNLQEINYLINTSNCRIPEDDPFNDEIIVFLENEVTLTCSKYDLLTYIDKTNGAVTLNINKSLLGVYSSLPVQCCYSYIKRISYEIDDDNEIEFTDCIVFEDTVNLTFPYIRVNCYNFLTSVYTNVHATTLPLVKETNTSPNKNKFSVLLVGIDSMSKSNIRRTMPRTYQFAEEHFFKLRGYNKIGLNTFPNLMAILTGYNCDQLDQICNNSVRLNTCHFIWDHFRESKYVTAFAEDECILSTFNYHRPGFSVEPTDFYYRPYFLASETLKVQKFKSMTFCAGPEISGQRILNAAKDFAISFKDEPSFGLFWTNSFSHDDINMAAAMDVPTFKFLSDPHFMSALDNTIFIFFSDHGFRFGDIRFTHSGWLEERLPFIYIRLPKKFEKLYPDKYKNFLTNIERLTVPYDLFYTFQDILEMGDSNYKKYIGKGCPECLSIFSEVPENRSCEDAHIDSHWCTCEKHTYIDPNDHNVRLIGQFILGTVNKRIKHKAVGSLCSTYSLRRVRSAGISKPYVNHQNETVNHYLLTIETNPTAMFEATVEASFKNGKHYFQLLGGMGRVDMYRKVTWCIDDNDIKPYCYCTTTSLFGYLKNIIYKLLPFI
ncbi:unnamed protein product [Psylliodes chrysocephalus]|uniref:Uncharacterized protein n=1 Tax=Psylliodes chrysocephalus TaxID=3402493 RepID=A0A9P0D7Y4_9CUCU|nr:unnamed protein product [Psylliodes chrysocephala]